MEIKINKVNKEYAGVTDRSILRPDSIPWVKPA